MKLNHMFSLQALLLHQAPPGVLVQLQAVCPSTLKEGD